MGKTEFQKKEGSYRQTFFESYKKSFSIKKGKKEKDAVLYLKKDAVRMV